MDSYVGGGAEAGALPQRPRSAHKNWGSYEMRTLYSVSPRISLVKWEICLFHFSFRRLVAEEIYSPWIHGPANGRT